MNEHLPRTIPKKPHVTQHVKEMIALGKNYHIIFGNGSSGRARYIRMERAVGEAIKWLRSIDRGFEAEQLWQWSRGSGGFLRTGSPYWIAVDADVYPIFMQALREAGYQAGVKDQWYVMARWHGRPGDGRSWQ